MRVAVGKWVAQYGSVFTDAHKVYTPCVDTDGTNLDATLCHSLQSLDDFIVEGIDVPIEMTTGFDEVVVETGNLFQFKLAVVERTEDGTTAGGAQVHGEIILGVVIDFHDWL